jgi:spore coat protein U-like protein
MKIRLSKLWFIVPVITVEVAFSAMASISVSDDDTTQLDFGGNIDAICKVRTKVKSRAINIDLTSAPRQKTSNIFIWCNTGQSQAQATYESVNGGYLVNENGNTIPYMIQIPQTLDNTSLATPQTVSQRAGSGINGSDKGRNIRVIPQVTGFEYAGTYRDTIQVTVAVN